MIHATAIIYPNVTIGENVEIGAYCIIGSPPEHSEHYNKPNKGVVINSGTVINGNVTIDAGINAPTIIGSDCFIMKGVHIGHDCHISNKSIIAAHSVFAGHCFVGFNSNIGINCSFHQFSLVGGGSMIGMGSVITKKSNCQPFYKMVGSPAKSIGINKHTFNKLSPEEIRSINEQYRNSENSGLFYNTKSGKSN